MDDYQDAISSLEGAIVDCENGVVDESTVRTMRRVVKQISEMENRYKNLCAAMVVQDDEKMPDDIDHEIVINAAKALRRIKTSISSAKPDQTRSLFICGYGGKKDSHGLPDVIDVCPEFGASGFAQYTKTKEYGF